MRLRAFVILGLAILIALTAFPGQAQAVAFTAGLLNIHEQKLTASNTDAEDLFGQNVSLDGDWAFIGAHLDDDKGVEAGAAYAFELGGQTQPGGRIVVGHDVNTFAVSRATADEATFAVNVANFLTEGHSTKNLLLFESHSDPLRNFSPVILDALSSAEFAVTVTSDYSTPFSSADAIFVSMDYPEEGFLDNQELINFVNSGHGVYLAGGVGLDPTTEATGWNTFLNNFGLQFESSYNGLNIVSITSSHPIFSGVTSLRSGIGQSIISLETNLDAEIVQFAGEEGVYAVVEVAPHTCTLELALGYADGTLTMDFELGTQEPAVWSTWMFVGTTPIRLWAAPLLEPIDPAISFPIPVPGFPSIGRVIFLTWLTTSEGVTCWDSEAVDTGATSSAVPSAGELRDLLPRPNGVLQGN